MTGYDAYKLYIALKNHFNSPTYDYFRYEGKTRANIKSFERRDDKHFFDILAKHKDVERFILANIIEDTPNVWASKIANEQEAENNYKVWLKRQESLTYTFKNEIDLLEDDFNSNLVCSDGQYPLLLKMVLQKRFSVEGLIILNELAKFFRYWNKNITDTVIWPTKYSMFKKYKPFVKYDADKFKGIVVERFKAL